MVANLSLRCLQTAALLLLMTGCSAYQPTKNVWKGTKNLWYTYVSPPASVNYEEKGDLSPRALALANSMIGIDVELGKFERTMLNADKPPTREWLNKFFASFPWISGFTGVKYDGTILGQEPATSQKELDYIPLLYEDAKQNSRALRGDVQNTPLGPEVMLAAPLYDGNDFLGVVVAHFDMRAVMQYSEMPQDIVVLSPQALLWPGKYDFASTPLAGVNWSEVVTKSSSGTCANATGVFYYMVRYLGNLPLVFAVPESGSFPEGDGNLEQGLAFFPQEREKLPPPPQPERKEKGELGGIPSFEPENVKHASDDSGGTSHVAGSAPAEIQPGSQESVLLERERKKSASQRVRERRLEGENVDVSRIGRAQRRGGGAMRRQPPLLQMDEIPREEVRPPMVRPSPFGPREDDAPPKADSRPSPFGPPSNEDASEKRERAGGAASEQTRPESRPATNEDTSSPARLPDGRPSPFGPRN